MAAPRAIRRGYLDWLRGLAVLIMIEAHVLDSWMRLDARDSTWFGLSMIAGGMGAPLFLFLAGVSVVLSAGSKARRLGDDGAAAAAVARRGLQIFGLAFLFRLQAVIVSWGAWRSMLKVDILNIMGPSIVAAALLWGALHSARWRLFAFALAAAGIAFLTPPIRSTELLSVLPDPIEGYLRPRPGFTNFAFFPWSGFVFAGACIGILLEAARTSAAERRANLTLAVIGALIVAGGFAASYGPSPFVNSQFLTSSLSFFLIRTGVLVAAVGAAYAWEQRPHGAARWSPLRQLGRTSLFIYWIHIELIYGLIVRPLHKSMSLGEAWFGVLIFSILMVIASVLKEKAAAAWTRRRQRTANGGAVSVL